MKNLLLSFYSGNLLLSESLRIGELIILDVVATIISVLPFLILLIFMYKSKLLSKKATVIISLLLTAFSGYFSTSINMYYYPFKALSFFIFEDSPAVLLSDVFDIIGHLCINSFLFILCLFVYGISKKSKDKKYISSFTVIFLVLLPVILCLYPNALWVFVKLFGSNMEYSRQLSIEKSAGEKTLIPYFKKTYLIFASGRIETIMKEIELNGDDMSDKTRKEYEKYKKMYDEIFEKSCEAKVPDFYFCGKVIVKNIIDGNYDKAIKLSERAAEKNPSQSKYYNLYKLHSYMFKGDFVTAWEISNGEYSKFTPKNEGSLVKAEIYRGLKDYKTALLYADKYEKKDHCRSKLLKMSIYADAGDKSESKKYYESFQNECKNSENCNDYELCIKEYGYLKNYDKSVFAHFPDSIIE